MPRGLALILPLAFFIGPRRPTLPLRALEAPSAGAECPGDSLSITPRNDRGEALGPAIQHVPLSGPIAGIPEFHDCQRFVDSASLATAPGSVPRATYGSLYAIFAALHLELLKDTSSFATSVPVATIYSYGGEYPPLHIKPGFNCLFLRYGAGAWSATMVAWGPTDSSCVDNSHPASDGTALEVHANAYPDFQDPDDYPPVARWDFDPIHLHQYIGVRCGSAWCEIGEPNFKPSAPYMAATPPFDPVRNSAALPSHPSRVYRVKGWYDDQQLATGSAAELVPGRVRGYLFPNPALDYFIRNSDDPSHADMANFPVDAWVQVADAFVTNDYKNLFKRGFNKIYICREGPTGMHCGLSFADRKFAPWMRPLNSCDGDPNTHRRWWAKLVWPDESAHYECIKRTDHAAALLQYEATNPGRIRIPAAARWRWILDDEQRWTSCPTGSCTGQ